MGRLKVDFHTIVNDGSVELRGKHDEQRRDDGQQSDARDRHHEARQDVLGHLRSDTLETPSSRRSSLVDAGTNAVVPVHPLLDEHIPLEHDERQHRY